MLPATAVVVSVRGDQTRRKVNVFRRVDIGRAESRSSRVADRVPVSYASRDQQYFRDHKMDIGAATDATGSALPRVRLVFCL